MALPVKPGPNLPIGTVFHRALDVWADGDDVDKFPELSLIAETEVEFKANIRQLTWGTGKGAVSLKPSPVRARYDDSGILRLLLPDGTLSAVEGVRLFANNDPNIVETNWTWSATWSNSLFTAVPFQIATNVEYNLADAIMQTTKTADPKVFADLLELASTVQNSLDALNLAIAAATPMFGKSTTEIRWTGTAWPPRPVGAPFGVRFLSTNDPAASAPPALDLQIGDIWTRHPNAV